MNSSDNARLHLLLAAAGLTKNKGSIILGFTNGRTEHSSLMTDEEAGQMLKYLQGQVKPTQAELKKQKMRRKIISLAHTMHWYHPGTSDVDMTRLDEWCKKYGMHHRPLNEHNLQELAQLVTQFTQVVNSYLSDL